MSQDQTNLPELSPAVPSAKPGDMNTSNSPNDASVPTGELSLAQKIGEQSHFSLEVVDFLTNHWSSFDPLPPFYPEAFIQEYSLDLPSVSVYSFDVGLLSRDLRPLDLITWRGTKLDMDECSTL